MVYWHKEKKRWYFQFRRRFGGQQINASKLLPEGWSRAQADKYDRQESARLYAQASGIEPREHLITDAVAVYLEDRCTKLANGKKAGQDLAQLVDLIEGKPFSAIPEVCAEYINANTNVLAPATIRNRLAYLRAAARYAFKSHHHIGDADTLMRIAMPAVQNYRTNRATPAEVAQIVHELHVAGDPDTAALVTLARYTAQRWVSELLSLDESHIKRIGGEAWLECGKTKNGTPNLVPVFPEHEWALVWIPFDRWGAETYYRRFKRACKAIGRPDLWMHDLRRSFASDVLSAGGTIDDVQVGLNQKSRAAAERYSWMDVDGKREIFRRGRDAVSQKLHTVSARGRGEKPKKVA